MLLAIASPANLAIAVRETVLADQETNLLHFAKAAKEDAAVVDVKLNAADAKLVEACK
jgi:hypothetical protein